MQRNKTKGSALARVQAVSPGFRAALVQPSAALRPFRFAPRVGDPPRLDSCYPGLACDAAGALAEPSPKSIFRKEPTPYEHQSRDSRWIHGKTTRNSLP